MGNSPNKLNYKLIETHNNTTAKSKKKILLIGTNVGKSHWFNNSQNHKKITGITYKIAAFNIGDKLPDIETIIYDTPENASFFNETLKYISSANGLILTYSLHNVAPLTYLEKCIDTLDENMNQTCSCLLLGMTETRKNNTENNFYYAELIIERANQLASRYGLMHMQIDISINIKTDTPYICLLRKIMKQKQAVNSPVVTFEDVKLDIIDDPIALSPPLIRHHESVPVPNVEAMAIYQSVVYGNNALLLSQNNSLNPNPIIRSFSMNVESKPSKDTSIKLSKQCSNFSLKSLHAYETNEKKSNSAGMYDTIKEKDDDMVCRMEFQRFFEESLGRKRSGKYLKTFREREYDDIRLVDPEIFDADFFKSDDIKMDRLDQKLFQKEIKKYNKDKIKFQSILDKMNMIEKYRKSFENRGIATLWSFHYYITSVKHIEHIVKNQSDAKIIWNELCSDKEDTQDSEGSDSEDLYEGNNDQDSVITGHTN